MRRRLSARVVLIDAEDRVLLFCWRDAFPVGGRDLWITPGGGLEPGETFEEAARRELAEEVGLAVDSPGRCVWHRELPLPDHGMTLVDRYYLLRVASHDVDRRGHDDEERRNLGEHRWWGLGEIAASEELFSPRDLARRLAPLLAGEMPEQPLDISD